MSDFEKWFKSLNENGRVTYFLGQEGRISEEAWNHQQSKIDELQKQVDALKGLAQTFWEKSSEKHKQGKVWESKSLGECADEILDELEQALKGGDE